MDAILSDIFERLPIGAIIIFAIIGAAFWAGSVWRKVKTLPCKDHEEELKKISDIASEISSLNGKVSVLLMDRGSSSTDKVAWESNSPIRISSYGKGISESVGLEKFVNDNWDFTYEYIHNRTKGSMNPYDIQQVCFDVAFLESEKVLSTEGFDKLRLKAFSEGVALYDFQRLVGLIARNKYFDQLGINIEEIDKHDPNKQTDSPK